MRFKAKLPLDDIAFHRQFFAWTGPENAPVFADTAKSLSWPLPESARVDLQNAQLAALQERIKNSKFKALDLSSASLDAKARMPKGLPVATLAYEGLCQSPQGGVASACQSFKSAWQARAKALDASAKKQLRQAVKKEMKDVMKYVAEQKRAASKGRSADIGISSSPVRIAAEQCQALSDIKDDVCTKGGTYFNSGLCSTVKGCLSKVEGPVKAIIAKLEAAVEREARKRNRAKKGLFDQCMRMRFRCDGPNYHRWPRIKCGPSVWDCERQTGYDKP